MRRILSDYHSKVYKTDSHYVMNLPQTKILLEKIISLYKTLSADEKNISPIERDLMLSYVRQLYETVLDTSGTPSVSVPIKSTPAPQPVVAPPPPPPKVEYKAPTPPPPPVQQPKPVVVEQPQPVYVAPKVAEHAAYIPPPPPPPTPVVEQPKPTPTAHTSHAGHVPADVAALFEENTGKELSDKLANTPIADLTKAFGFNDRLLTQNELFGGNKTVFDEVVKDLNNSSGFDTAKGLLVSLATKYHWTANDDRKKQAKAFIKLVRRRFK
jgi:hypothetical protein